LTLRGDRNQVSHSKMNSKKHTQTFYTNANKITPTIWRARRYQRGNQNL